MRGEKTSRQVEKTEMSMEETDRQDIERLYREMWEALLAKDMEQLDRMHDDGFVLVHMTGMRQSKEEYLRSVRDGGLNYFTERMEEIEIRHLGENRAKLIGRSQVEAAVFGGSKHTWPLELAFDVAKVNGRRMLMNAKASTYGRKTVASRSRARTSASMRID